MIIIIIIPVPSLLSQPTKAQPNFKEKSSSSLSSSYWLRNKKNNNNYYYYTYIESDDGGLEYCGGELDKVLMVLIMMIHEDPCWSQAYKHTHIHVLWL